MNNNQQFTFLDMLNVLSFIIGLLNLEENLTQTDKQDLIQALNDETKIIIKEMHEHLKSQDDKLDTILDRLEVIEDDIRGNFF